MFPAPLDWLARGLTQASYAQMAIYFLVVTQLTIFTVTLYYHRSQAHRGVDFHPLLAHFFRFWGWLTTSMVVKEWAAIHRKHHAKCETADDPHSPQFKGIHTVLWRGAELYQEARADRAMIDQYGKGCPDDWLERHLYARYQNLGILLMLAVDLALFGVPGLVMWAAQMAWMPVWAAGVINGLGHWWGYRNFDTDDKATNLAPWGVWVGGEELHNNHHAFPSSAKFALRRYEFDIGWFAIKSLRALRLATVLRVAPRLNLRHPAGDDDAPLAGCHRLFPTGVAAGAEARSRRLAAAFAQSLPQRGPLARHRPARALPRLAFGPPAAGHPDGIPRPLAGDLRAAQR